MSDSLDQDGFQDIDNIVVEPLKFKIKLAIGEDAYTSLKVKNAVVQAWDVAGVATTAAVVAKSSVVASTFFAPAGWLAALGIGAAVTPIGWVVAAGVVTGGAWYGITRHLKKATASRVTVVPKFINTPLDVLALGLFDLMAPLALKMAAVNGVVEPARRQRLDDYFVGEWGYDAGFVDAGIQHIESRLEEVSVQELAQTLAEFASQNRDCNFRTMSQEMLEFLREIVIGDSSLEITDENAIAEIEGIFEAANRVSIGRKLGRGLRSLRGKFSRLLSSRKSPTGN
jgi:hypothetical protein